MRSLDEIKKLRKKYNINQKDLATKSGVSQSLIAKVEAGKVEPTFNKAQKIFQALDAIQQKEEPTAGDIVKRKVTFAKTSDKISNIIKIMKNSGISQMPVKDLQICGLISESIILRSIADNVEKISTLTVGEIMEDAPPIVSTQTGIKLLLELLTNYPIVLVSDKGNIKGIIAKSDILGKI